MSKQTAVPELDHLSGSWICPSPDADAGYTVREVYDRKNAEERRKALADFDREFLK